MDSAEHCDRTGDGLGSGPRSGPACGPGRALRLGGGEVADPRAPPRLALFGLPSVVAEPVTMLAEILGWQVLHYPPGPAMRPPVQACMAMLPACSAVEVPPLVLWSPQSNLNEHISLAGLSIMDQPLCVTIMEQMLETLRCEP